MRRTLLWSAALVFVLAARGAAEPRQGDFAVHDLSLWIVDAAAPLANARTNSPSAFPATVGSSRAARTSLAERRAAPFGLITFYGSPADKLDVELRMKSGSFVAHWPPAESLPNRLRWARDPGNAALVDKLADESLLSLADEEHWFRKARQGEALFVRHGARAERFLAYDAELNLPAPIRLQGGPDKFTVANASDSTVYDVLIARRTPQGVRVAWLDELPKSVTKPISAAAAAAPSAQPPKTTAPAAGTSGLFGAAKRPLVPATVKEKSADAAPPASPKVDAAPAPPQPGGVELALSEPLPSGSPEAAAATTKSLAERLSRQGLSANEIEVFLSQFASLLFDSEDLVVACRLEAGAIDEKVSLSVFPVPTKIVRVPIVVVHNADPQMRGQIDQLVAQLGDSSFAARDAAEKRLTELGPLAFDALKKAISNADMEIVIRSERILLKQSQQAAGRQGAGGAKAPPPAPAAQAPGIINGVLRLFGR